MAGWNRDSVWGHPARSWKGLDCTYAGVGQNEGRNQPVWAKCWPSPLIWVTLDGYTPQRNSGSFSSVGLSIMLGVPRDMWSIERQSGTELVLLTLDAFLLSVVIPVSSFYMKNAPVNHDGTHFLNSILCFAQQIFIKCSPSLCDGEQAPDKQIEKRHALWPKFQSSRGFRQAVEEHIGLIPKKKNAQTEHTLQKRT